VTKAVRKGVELNLGLDNLTNHRYYETQNYFESRLTPTAPPVSRIHATPGYPLGVTVGITFRFE
jgi:outer membrane receptor protein involved in Fe transport